MNAVAAPIQPTRGDTSAPQLRTILLTDLCDSTQLVERLGDGVAAELFRQHDLLVLQLQQQWRGRLIDRSDGMLLLFERPIDGLGFALDYARGLRELGKPHRVDLKARAGLHVGEVLTWRNSDEAVKVGAKPLEVEGLAKPMAARLMTMARPGQVLVSAVAEPLAHRSARELGERGQQLLWKSYGRWRFKGLPTPQEVFEVGEAGTAPLRMPKASPKAWRDIPLWRRPGALAAELALVLGIGLGIWFVTRPQPAIAFNQRDWVVVADLRNLTGQAVLDDSLEQAFRISLEQSRYVNVLSDLKARQTLERMRLPPETELTRAIASEIAIRDGARAVILPTVAEIGGHVRVSAEVIDPHSQTTVYSDYADGRGAQSALASIDDVTAGLREKLGETLESIEEDSAPLPQVTTKNLEALRAFALGQKAYAKAEFDTALTFYQRATSLDPRFALAWLGQVRAHHASASPSGVAEPLAQVQSLRDRLPTREALYLDGWVAQINAPAEALGKWKELAALYPDYWPAVANTVIELRFQNEFEAALPLAVRSAVPQNGLLSLAYDNLGRVRLGLEQYDLAAEAFDKALAAGYGDSLRRRVDVDAAQRNFTAAEQRLRKAPSADRYAFLEKIAVAVDQGQWKDAQAHSEAALKLIGGADSYDGRSFLLTAGVVAWLSGDKRDALKNTRAAARLALSNLSDEPGYLAIDDAELALAAGLFAQRLGEKDLARHVLSVLESHAALMSHPRLAEVATVLRAVDARLGGRPEDSLELLEPLVDGSERYQTRVALQDAYAVAGKPSQALEQARWLQRHRGLAYIEHGCGQCLQALNVADSTMATLRAAELLLDDGQDAQARKALKRFDQLWASEDLPDHLSERREAVCSLSRLCVL